MLMSLVAVTLAASERPDPDAGPVMIRDSVAGLVSPSYLPDLDAGGPLIVLTLTGPTSHFQTRSGELVGYERDLATALAEHMGVPVEFRVKPDIRALIRALNVGEGHVAAAGLTATDARRAQGLRFGPAYKLVREQLVCRRGGVRPRRAGALAEASLIVQSGSSYEETLETRRVALPELTWDTQPAGSALPLLELVDARLYDCTVADSHLVDIARLLMPELSVSLNLTRDRPLAWLVSPRAAGLEARLEAEFAWAHTSGLLDELDHFWFGRFGDFDYVDVATFVERLDTRLPQYQPYFEAAAEAHDLEWQILAAQAYQESHWDPDAVSATGVRGLMMLTLPTARQMGVEDREDPLQSIEGGSRYLANLLDRLPDGIPQEERIWFALAAYNVGMGHLYDARRLAEQRGLDKNNWQDIATTLPLLSDPEHYPATRHGYARGHEPVRYVEKIQEYRIMLLANQEI